MASKIPSFCVALLASASSLPVAAQELRGSIDEQSTVQHSGWYLRADVGLNLPSAKDISQAGLTANQGEFVTQTLTNTASIGFGAGYRVNKNLRFDATWETRTASNLDAMSNIRILNSRNQLAADIYSSYDAEIETQVALLNAYYDIGTWNRLTPFVGGSVGVARNTIKGLHGNNNATINIYSNTAPHDLQSQLTEASSVYSKANTATNLAWGLTAGLAYEATDNLTLEGSARYLNLGDTASTSLINCTCGADGEPLKLGKLTSVDLRVGMRWAFNGRSARPTAPLPVYQPEYNTDYRPDYNPVYK